MEFKHGNKVLITDHLILGDVLGFNPGVVAQVRRDHVTANDIHLVHLADDINEDFGFYVDPMEFVHLKLVEEAV